MRAIMNKGRCRLLLEERRKDVGDVIARRQAHVEKHRYVVDTGEAILLPRPTILLCPHQLRKCQQPALEKMAEG